MEQHYNEEVEIDLMELIMVLIQKWWVMALSAAIVGLCALIYSSILITPTYESTTRVIVLNTDKEVLTTSDLQLGTQLTKDYPELIKSRFVIESVIEEMGFETTYEQFIKKVAVKTAADSRIIDITLTDPDPVLAKETVDKLRDIASKRIKEVMEIEAVNLVDEGNIPLEPSDPSVKKWTAIGILLGGFAAAAFILIVYLLDDTIKTSEDVERHLGLSTLAMIPIINTEGEKSSRRRFKSNKMTEEEIEEQEAREQTKQMVVVPMDEME